jgi:C_GCAxxG_C_C family probable redox protein
MEEKTMELRNSAGNYFKKGYNCAEALFLAFQPYLGHNLGKDAVKMMTGFGSGIGQAGCICGALTASLALLNLYTGRTSNDQSRDNAYQHAQAFHHIFIEQFGSSCCRNLNKHPFETPEHLRTCLKITGNTAKLLMHYLLEQGFPLKDRPTRKPLSSSEENNVTSV